MFFARRGRVDVISGAGAGGPAAAAMPRAEPLREALLESRLRWQDFGILAADFGYETDAEGRLTFVFPATVFGHASDGLVGTDGGALRMEPQFAGLDPFRPVAEARGILARVSTAAGVERWVSLSVAPRFGQDGVRCGGRGVATDVTAQQACERAATEAVRQAATIDRLLACIRTDELGGQGMQCLLGALAESEAADGAAVLRLCAQTGGPGYEVLHAGVPEADVARVADGALPLLRGLARDAQAPDGTARAVIGTAGAPLLAGHILTRVGDDTVLLLWRAPDGMAFTPADTRTALAAVAVMRVVLEQEAVQRQLALATRTDPLTGLLHARAFADDLPRYLDRLDRDGEPGTMLHADLDTFGAVNLRHGHMTGDMVLARFAALLRETVRPTDVVARIGGDLFAVWLQGADHLTAAERAERLRVETPRLLRDILADTPAGERGAPLSVSIGIASRRPSSYETSEDLMRRAAAALAEVKASGRAHWRVSPMPGDAAGLGA